LDEFFTYQDTALLVGTAVPPEVLQDDTVGRVVERLYATGTMQVCTACAVRADRVFGFDQRSGHVATTSITVSGDARPPEEAEEQEAPFRMTYGSSKDKRPDLKPCVLSTLCVDRAVPLWSKPEDGHASEKTVHHTVRSHIATFLATQGVAPGAYISVADAALVTEAHLAALGAPLCITRLPATENACGRLMPEAVAHNAWAEVGVLAHTKPTKHRPGTSSKASEGEVTRYGRPYRAVVGHSSAQDKRQQQRRERARQTSQSPRQTAARTAEQQEYGCRADAEAAAAPLRAVPTASHLVDVTVEERPIDGRGRPSSHTPRTIKTRHYRLKTTIKPDAERISRREDEAGCFVLRTNVPTAGDLAHRARDILTVYKEPQGTEQNYGFLKDPVMMQRLLLKQPARLEA
jgi:transposase